VLIRTKILATIGPASGDHDTLRRLVAAGCDAFRINLSHGDADQHQGYLDGLRAVEAEAGKPLAAVADLCGPKIRVGPIAGGSVLLADGQELTIRREPVEGGPEAISTTLGELVDEVQPGEPILLDDGRIALEVTEAGREEGVRCRVLRGGVLSASKGVNLPRTDLSLQALTEKDRADVDWLAGRGFDYVALSFVRSAADVQELRRLLTERDCGAHIIAKIEKPQAVAHIEDIVAAADAIMVARGDLGVEMDLPAVPMAQKRIAALCQRAGKPCIIATQMLESMTQRDVPTRAEVSDVANAVLDHADAVMLSGETAIGEHPVRAVAMMNDIVRAAGAYDDERNEGRVEPVADEASPTTAALAAAAQRVLCSESVAAVAVYTATGGTARLLAKSRVPRPILALSHRRETLRRVALYYGVIARQADTPEHTREVLTVAARFATELGIAAAGDRIVVLSGRPVHEPGHTNTLVVHTIGAETGTG